MTILLYFSLLTSTDLYGTIDHVKISIPFTNIKIYINERGGYKNKHLWGVTEEARESIRRTKPMPRRKKRKK